MSVVIPCLNEAAHVGQLLSGLAEQEQPAQEIILVDGGSSDGTLEAVEAWKQRHPAISLTVLPVERWPIPRALNAGIRSARGEVILRLDAHCRPLPGYVAESVAALRSPGAGVVGGYWQIAPGGSGAWASAIAVAVASPFGAGDARYRLGPKDDRPVDVDTVPFGCFAKKLWAELGGFDERLPCNEDYEFNYRVRRAGLRVILLPGVRSLYFARPTLPRLARQYFRYGWWKADMLRLHPRSLRWRQAVPAAFTAALLASALLAAVMPPLAWAFPGLLLLYFTSAFLASAHACAGRGSWRLFPALPLVFATIHLSWGAGLLAHLVGGGAEPVAGRAEPLAKGQPEARPGATSPR